MVVNDDPGRAYATAAADRKCEVVTPGQPQLGGQHREGA
jgi:hypothetical protein